MGCMIIVFTHVPSYRTYIPVAVSTRAQEAPSLFGGRHYEGQIAIPAHILYNDVVCAL